MAYSMVIHPSSAVKLKVTRVGSDLGFSIFAARDIKLHEAIYELTGAMPSDSEAQHSQLSAITPHQNHSLPDLAPRILFGPARFINHLCKNFNVEVRTAFFLSHINSESSENLSFAVRRTQWHSTPMPPELSKKGKRLQWTMGQIFSKNVPV